MNQLERLKHKLERKTNHNIVFEKTLISLRDNSLKNSIKLKMYLKEHELNLVTVESVTSGLIASTLTDVGHAGDVLYGAHVVYDTDAKRKWLNITTPNLYNKETAKQMAKNILLKSRAMVSLSITGNATPYKDSLGCTGIAHIAVGIRQNIKDDNIVVYDKK
jgi:nicotinamide mononucleotide (NMN) deamidase PncC